MYAVTEKDAQRNLGRLIRRAVADVEPTIVIGDEGDRIVLVSLAEFNAWQETLYLLSSPANVDHLQRSLAQMREGKVHYHELIEP
ncbi:MAG: type II toxin-antitoxin system prevent-host-death family antitoxin [Anaerolinea sp.]|nr:type II toxin-antitoxin system prevent-host-death family antitoxin [Anaerolinea sp.]